MPYRRACGWLLGCLGSDRGSLARSLTPVLLVLVLMSGLVFGVAPLLGSGWRSAPDSDMVPTVAPSPPMEPTISPPEGAGPFHPKTYREDGSVVMPVTFPDGTTAEVLYPEPVGLGTDVVASGAYVAGGPAKCHPDVRFSRTGILQNWARPGPPLAVFEGAQGQPVGLWRGKKSAEPWDVLAFEFGSWVVALLCEADPERDADALAVWARGVDAYEGEDGFMVLTPRRPLRLEGKDWQVGPRLHFENEQIQDHPLVKLTIAGCSPSPIKLLPGSNAQGCLEGGIGVYALGDREFLREVAAGLRVRNVDRPRR